MVPEKYSIKSLFSQRKLQKKHSGFLLIEIMSAIALFSGMVVIFAYSCGQIIAWQNESNMYGNAVEISSNILEKIKYEGKIPHAEQINQYTVQCKAHAIDPISLPIFYTATCAKNYFDIELSVSWKGFNNSQKKHIIHTCVWLNNE